MFHPQALRRLALTFCVTLLGACVSSPPVQEMSDARQAITAAEAAEADRYAATTMTDARRYLAEAETLLRNEAYGAARMNAIRAKNRAVRALVISQTAAESTSE